MEREGEGCGWKGARPLQAPGKLSEEWPGSCIPFAGGAS